MGLKFLPKQTHSGTVRVVGVAVERSVRAVGFAVGFAVEPSVRVGFAVARSLAESCADAYEG